VTKLVLASRSASRIAMLKAAGIDVDIDPADVDEDAIGKRHEDPEDRATALAREKALRVSARQPGRLVLGGDQVGVIEESGVFLEKPVDADDQVRMLLAMSGRTHAFFPAAVLVKDGAIIAKVHEIVRVTFRAFTEPTARAYVATGEGKGSCGGYESENRGAQLIASIDGTQHAVMGLPLLGVLDALRRVGVDGTLP
jgi:septum formation protein